MSKYIKIIIASLTTLTIALIIFIVLPSIVIYNPPSPNIIKTDQGSFELKTGVSQSNFRFTSKFYKEYENHAKDYYSSISKAVKDKNLVINGEIYSAGEGASLPSITFTVDKYTNKHFLEATYMRENGTNFFKNEFSFVGFFAYQNKGVDRYQTLEELLKTPEYQNLKLN